MNAALTCVYIIIQVHTHTHTLTVVSVIQPYKYDGFRKACIANAIQYPCCCLT